MNAVAKLKFALFVLFGGRLHFQPCNQHHAPNGSVVVTREDYVKLTRAADKLKYALGFIARAQQQEFQRVVRRTQGR